MPRIWSKGPMSTGGGGEGETYKAGEGLEETGSKPVTFKIKAKGVIQTMLGVAAVINENVKEKSLEGNRLAKETLGEEEIQTNAIGERVIASGAVVAAKIAAEAVIESKLASALLAKWFVLLGRAGGQVAKGGTAASENLTLESTANATKGKILFGASSAYEETKTRFGIGNASPEATIEGKGTAPAEVAGATGTVGDKGLLITAATGGNTSIVTTGTGGKGGSLEALGGTGGTAPSAKTKSTGGAGGVTNLKGGVGGSAKVALKNLINVGGEGGSFALVGGLGGVAEGGAENTSATGGAGGLTEIAGGTGALATGAIENFGGSGGEAAIRGGKGALGETKGGEGGVVRIEGGVGGSSLAGTKGIGGNVRLRTGDQPEAEGSRGSIEMFIGTTEVFKVNALTEAEYTGVSFGITGVATVGGAAEVTGNLIAKKELLVTGASKLTGALTAKSTAVVESTLKVTGATTLKSTAVVEKTLAVTEGIKGTKGIGLWAVAPPAAQHAKVKAATEELKNLKEVAEEIREILKEYGLCAA